ncbi:MAG: deoxyribodipyrimidine photo-lyase, partial [Chloroflexi bacterium]
MTTTAIWWLRRDLRLTDNQALARALEHANAVIPVFVLDPALLNSPYVGPKRLAFLLGGLRQLDADLQRRGSRLVVRRGRPVDELAKLLAESGATAIFAEADYSPFARRRDDEVARRLPLHVTDGLTVHPPSAVLKANGAPYTVFTPFSRAWKSLPMPGTTAVLPAPESIPTPPGLSSIPLPAGPALQERVPFIPGEAEARRRLNHFAPPAEPAQHRGESVFGYADGRNKLDSAATSQLSPYLRFGMLSARQAVVRAIAAGAAATDSRSAKGAAAWLNQLIWREFFISILCHF